MPERRHQLRHQLFEAKGSKPLAAWSVVGSVRHQRSPDKSRFVYALEEGSPATRITTPRSGALGLMYPRLFLELWGDPAMPFGIEIVARDTGGIARTVTLSRDCVAPEMKHGSPKAKLPLALALSGTAGAGWRHVDVDLQTLIPRCFNGAGYERLDAVAIFGVCELRAVECRMEPPPSISVAGSSALVALFVPLERGTALSGTSGVVEGGGDDEGVAWGDEGDVGPHAFITPAERAAAQAAAELEAFEGAKAAAKEAQLAFLRSTRQGPDDVGDEPVGFFPIGKPTQAEHQTAAARGSQPRRLQAAVRKLQAVQHLSAARDRSRRPDDPREHRIDGGASGGALDYLRTCLPTYPLTYLPTYPLTHLPTYPPTYLLTD